MCPQQVEQLPHGVRVQPRLQHLLEQGELVPHMAAERGQDRGLRTARGQTVEDLAPVEAEDVGQRAAQPQAIVVQRLVDAVAGPAALADQPAAVPAQLAQLAESAGRHIARPAQAELADAGQPQAVRHVALAALDLLELTIRNFGD